MPLNPQAKLVIQTEADEDNDGDVAAIEISFPSSSSPLAPLAEATISAAVSDESVVITADMKISGIKYSDMQQIQENGFLRIDAGYPDGHALVQPIFFGRFKAAEYDVEGGKRTWAISADPFPLDLARIPVSLNAENILIGDAILKVFGEMGLPSDRNSNEARITGLAFGDMSTLGEIIVSGKTVRPTVTDSKAVATIPIWNARGPAFQVLKDLVELLRANIRDTYGQDRRIALIPDTVHGFAYNIIDFDTSEPFQILDYDVDTPFVISAGTIPQEDAPTDFSSTTDQGADEVPVDETDLVGETPAPTKKYRQYKLVIIFDPRVTLGTVIEVKDSDIGLTPIQVTSYKHILNGRSEGWRTEIVGDILGGIFFDTE